MKDILNFINGEYVKNTSGKTFEKRTPIDNSLIGLVHEAGKPEVDAAVAAASAALKGPWGKLSVVERVKLLDEVAREINRRFDDFLQAEIADTGKPAHLASHIDIPRGAANFQIFADTIKNMSTECFEMATPDGKTALSYGLRVPRGVIAVICPWNLPLLLMTWKAGPALACGNTVVIKPSEETPSTATLLGEVMNTVGVPKGVYNVVHGFGPQSAGEFLTTHPGINGITFTGETRTGTAIMKAGAEGNQPDHSLIDRKDKTAGGLLLDLLCRLTEARTNQGTQGRSPQTHDEQLARVSGSTLEHAWLSYVSEHGHRKPDRGQHTIPSADACADFFYDDLNLAIFVDGPHHDRATQRADDAAIDRRLDDLGYLVVRFPKEQSAWPAIFTAHADLFGAGR